MVARWPERIKPGTETDHISAFWDFLPTAMEVAGAKTPEGLDGISYLPAMLGDRGKQGHHPYLYWEFAEQGGRQGVRQGNWKGIRLDVAKDPEGPLELYNLETDLGEESNVADAHPDVVARLAKYMDDAHTPSEMFPLKPSEKKGA